MKCTLIKEVHEYKDKKTQEVKKITNFYLELDNGESVRIKPNSWIDDKKVSHSNYSILSALATDRSKLPF